MTTCIQINSTVKYRGFEITNYGLNEFIVYAENSRKGLAGECTLSEAKAWCDELINWLYN